MVGLGQSDWLCSLEQIFVKARSLARSLEALFVYSFVCIALQVNANELINYANVYRPVCPWTECSSIIDLSMQPRPFSFKWRTQNNA